VDPELESDALSEGISRAQEIRQKHRRERALLKEEHARQRREAGLELATSAALELATDTIQLRAVIERARRLATEWSLSGAFDNGATRYFGNALIKALDDEVSMIDEMEATPQGRSALRQAEENSDLMNLLEQAHEIILDSTPVLPSLEKSWKARKKRFMTEYRKRMGL
jgi:hypothetical protein